MNNLILRPMREDDKSFIISSWLNSYLSHGNLHRRPSKTVYYKEHQEIVKKKLDTCSVTIATTSEDQDQIIGYIVHDLYCVHYLYVKNLFRGFKIASKLLQTTDAGEYSHHTSYADDVKKGHKFNPYLFYK